MKHTILPNGDDFPWNQIHKKISKINKSKSKFDTIPETNIL